MLARDASFPRVEAHGRYLIHDRGLGAAFGDTVPPPVWYESENNGGVVSVWDAEAGATVQAVRVPGEPLSATISEV